MEKKKRVVILESEGIIALDLKAMVQKYNLEVAGTFRNFPSLFNYIAADKPDVVIVDSNDDSVMEHIIALTEDIKVKVIYLSDLPDTDMLEVDPDNCALLRKPYNRKDVLLALKKCC